MVRFGLTGIPDVTFGTTGTGKVMGPIMPMAGEYVERVLESHPGRADEPWRCLDRHGRDQRAAARGLPVHTERLDGRWPLDWDNDGRGGLRTWRDLVRVGD